MSGVAVIDDALSISTLGGSVPDVLLAAAKRGPLITTGCWWFRACRASVRREGGRLSRRIEALDPDVADVLRRRVASPPLDALRVLGLVQVGYSAALLGEAYGLNLIAAEALAVATTLDAGLFVTIGNDGPRLREAAADRKLHYEVIEH